MPSDSHSHVDVNNNGNIGNIESGKGSTVNVSNNGIMGSIDTGNYSIANVNNSSLIGSINSGDYSTVNGNNNGIIGYVFSGYKSSNNIVNSPDAIIGANFSKNSPDETIDDIINGSKGANNTNDKMKVMMVGADDAIEASAIGLAALATLVVASDIYINTPEGKKTINAMYSALGQTLSDTDLKLTQIADTVKNYINERIQKNDIDPMDNTVYVFVNSEEKVTYVGRTNNYYRRQNEHSKRLKENNYEMVPVMTGLSKNEARGVEQVMISSYTLGALENARREIAAGNIMNAGKEGARAAQLLASYPENEWLDLMGR